MLWKSDDGWRVSRRWGQVVTGERGSPPMSPSKLDPRVQEKESLF